MLIAEYDYDTDIAVQRHESLMIGIAQGRSEGISQGAYPKALETAKILMQTAKNLIGIGLSIEDITQATGLSKLEVESL